MNIILAGLMEKTILAEGLRKRGCSVGFVQFDALQRYLLLEGARTADAILCDASSDPSPDLSVEWDDTPAEAAIRVAAFIRGLPDSAATSDGRKWKSIPIILLTGAPVFLETFDDDVSATNVVRCEGTNPSMVYRVVSTVVSEYRKRLLSEYEDLGFLVFEDHGRFRVGPALRPRVDLEGTLYSGVSDNRDRPAAGYWTVDRDLYGIERDIEEFEALINEADVSENDLQSFFEANPHFLLAMRFAQAIAHPRFSDADGRIYIPDFILKPIVAQKRDSGWEVLDLKTPQVRLLADAVRSGRPRLSQEVMKAVTQLRDYGDFFANAGNQRSVASVLGHSLRHPKLAVLIGRMPNDGDVQALELAQSREANVRIVTYDEVLETQRQLYTRLQS